MILLETVAVAFSMFSALPVPHVVWNEKNMRYALCAFPLVGVAAGLACWLWAALCQWLALPAIPQGAGLCLVPILVTGGIHLDGYADTCDARASHADMVRKQEILKDSHLGAFAAIKLCCYFVACWALWAALPRYNGAATLLGLCLSRSLSALAVASFPLAKNTGLAHTFATGADKKRVQLAMTVLAVVLTVGLCLTGGFLMAAAAWCMFIRYRLMAIREFGGLSGDLAGWFVQMAELWMLAALVLTQYVEGLL